MKTHEQSKTLNIQKKQKTEKIEEENENTLKKMMKKSSVNNIHGLEEGSMPY